MGYERYPRNAGQLGGYYGRNDPQDDGADYGSGRVYNYSGARDYEGTGAYDRGRDRQRLSGGNDRDRGDYGPREYGNSGYDRSEGGFGRSYYGQDAYRNAYGSDGRRFGGNQDRKDREPRRHDNDRGFFERAGDEVRSWFGDEEAERRREADMRRDEVRFGHDPDYHSWRRGQIAALDRDYDEYSKENQSRFEREFGAWRERRGEQRRAVGQVKEQMEVTGADGSHVGTVDKVRGERIVLARNDRDAGGLHHSIPCGWIERVDDKVVLNIDAEEAKTRWRNERRSRALFERERDDEGPHMLNRSFAGTYPDEE